MISQFNGKVLTCFFNVNGYLKVTSFNLDNFNPIENLSFTSEVNNLNPVHIKSFISADKTKALICYLLNWDNFRYDKYDINSNTITRITNNIIEEKYVCKNTFSSNIIQYDSKNFDKYIFGCTGNNRDILLLKFNSSFQIESVIYNKEDIIIKDCNCNGLSIVKLPNYDKYFFYLNCQYKPVVLTNNSIEELNKILNNYNENKLADQSTIIDIISTTHIINNSSIVNIDMKESTNNLKPIIKKHFYCSSFSRKRKY